MFHLFYSTIFIFTISIHSVLFSHDSKIVINANPGFQSLSNNPVFLKVQNLLFCYLSKTQNGRELAPDATNSAVLEEWIIDSLAGDRTAVAAALKYIVYPLSFVEYEAGFTIKDNETTQEWLIRRLKKCKFSRKEIKRFMHYFPKYETYPLNEHLKKAVIHCGLILFNDFLLALPLPSTKNEGAI